MNYKDNTVAKAGDDVVGVDAKGAEVRGRVVISHRYFAVASGGRLIGDLESKNFSVASVKITAPETEIAKK
jgi:hypothetical protein